MKTPGRALLGGEETPQAIRATLLSLLVACAILFGGMFCTYRVGLAANKLDHQLDHAREGLAEVQQSAQHQKGGAK
jgi:hypothetical protein